MALRLAWRKSPAFFTPCIGKDRRYRSILQLAAPRRAILAGGPQAKEVVGLRGCSLPGLPY
jgi:hypothetical protein